MVFLFLDNPGRIHSYSKRIGEFSPISNADRYSKQQKETKNIELTFHDKFDVFSTLQIQQTYSLDQVEQLPEIPIEAVDIEFEILTEDNNSDGADNFFARLLQPVVDDN